MGSVVVLTGSQQYWGDRPLRDVIKLHARNKITVTESDATRFVQSGGNNLFMEMPLVVVLNTFFGCAVKSGELEYSDDLVFQRDENYCQYWHFDGMGKKFMYKCPANDRTIDHVIPRSRGGANSFTNCVCACKTCNIKHKGNKTPSEAGLKLIRQPFVPDAPKGGWMCVPFNFNPENPAHVAYQNYLRKFAA